MLFSITLERPISPVPAATAAAVSDLTGALPAVVERSTPNGSAGLQESLKGVGRLRTGATTPVVGAWPRVLRPYENPCLEPRSECTCTPAYLNKGVNDE